MSCFYHGLTVISDSCMNFYMCICWPVHIVRFQPHFLQRILSVGVFELMDHISSLVLDYGTYIWDIYCAKLTIPQLIAQVTTRAGITKMWWHLWRLSIINHNITGSTFLFYIDSEPIHFGTTSHPIAAFLDTSNLLATFYILQLCFKLIYLCTCYPHCHCPFSCCQPLTSGRVPHCQLMPTSYPLSFVLHNSSPTHAHGERRQ